LNLGNIAAAAVPALIGWGVGELTGDPIAGQIAGAMAGIIAAMYVGGPVGIAVASAAIPIMAFMAEDEDSSPFKHSRKVAGRQLRELTGSMLPNTMYEIGMTDTPEELNATLNSLASLGLQGSSRLQFEGVDDQGHVVDPRKFRITGGYEQGEQMLPQLNETLGKSIEARLALMDQAAQGNEAARAMLEYTGKASGMARDRWINDNYEPFMRYNQWPHEEQLRNEMQGLQNLMQWEETSEGSRGRWMGTPEQQARLQELQNQMEPGMLGFSGSESAWGRNPDLFWQHAQNPTASAKVYSPLETYEWETYLQDNPEMVQRLTDYIGKQQAEQAQMQQQPQMPMDVSQMTPAELDMYRKWLGSGVDEDLYQRWLGSGAGQDEDYMRMLMGAR
jgi:hypothetical protein